MLSFVVGYVQEEDVVNFKNIQFKPHQSLITS